MFIIFVQIWKEGSYWQVHLFGLHTYRTETYLVKMQLPHVIWGGIIGPRQANLVLIAYASSEGSGEPAHPRSLARTSAARSYKQWVKRNLQTESQIPGPSEWLGMRSWNLSWRNARRHKFAWRGSIYEGLKVWLRNYVFGLKWSLMRIAWNELEMHGGNFAYAKNNWPNWKYA